MKVYGHDFNNPRWGAFVFDGEPVPEIGETVILRDWSAEFQHKAMVTRKARSDGGWFFYCDEADPQTGFEYLDDLYAQMLGEEVPHYVFGKLIEDC